MAVVETELKHRIETAVKNIHQIRRQEADFQFVSQPGDVEADQDLVLYLTIKVRSAEHPDTVPQPQQNTVTFQDSHGEEVTASTESVSNGNTDIAATNYQHDEDANSSNPETQSQDIATTPYKIVETTDTTPNQREKSNNIDKKENMKVQKQAAEIVETVEVVKTVETVDTL